MKKKLLLIVLPLILIICFSSTAKAMTSEESTGVDSGLLHTYDQRFDDLSGGLTVTTTAVNNSGIMEAYVFVTVLCMNESMNFRLRIYDGDERMFIEVQNEDGIGSAARQFTVRTHMDTKELLWTAYVTDMTAEIFFAQISLFYLYDEDAEWTPPGEVDPNSISQKEHEKQVKIETRNTSLSYLAITFLAIFITGAVVIQRKGTGVKHFIKSKIKGEGD